MVYLANMGEEDLDGIAFGSDGTLYYPRMGRNQIWKRAPNGVTSLFAGTGSQGYGGDGTTVPTFFWPQAVAVDAAQNIYVSEWMNRRIRKYTRATGIWSTIVGPGLGTSYNGEDLPAAQVHLCVPQSLAMVTVLRATCITSRAAAIASGV